MTMKTLDPAEDEIAAMVWYGKILYRLRNKIGPRGCGAWEGVKKNTK